jgi:hypothetical protein
MRSTYDAALRHRSRKSTPYETKPPLLMKSRYGYTAGRRCLAASPMSKSRWAKTRSLGDTEQEKPRIVGKLLSARAQRRGRDASRSQPLAVP